MKKIFLITLAILLTLGITANVSAQSSYLFSVDKEDVNVYWNADGSQSLDYVWVFTNDANGHPIDFVDVGMPNGNFDMNTVSADVNGNAASVSTSDYQGSGTGFAVVMDSQTIGAGASGTIHVYVGRITGVLYPDSGDSAYASGVFAPAYFGSQYVSGTTALTMTFHLPPDMNENEPRWHAAPGGFPSEPQAGYDAENRVTYTWYSPSASASEQYTFGASFPASYVPEDAVIRTSALDAIVGMFAAFFGFVASSLPCLIFIAIFIGSPVLSIIQANRRKLKYLPPKVSIEGHGIKRGLTAVESAILMEQPLDKVMTMTLFSVIKKNAASVKTRDPLEIESVQPLPETLHDYERNFLKAFKIPDKKLRQEALETMMVGLVKNVAEKMRGFSRKETLDYYKAIMEKAWQQVETADTPEVKSQKFEEALEWTMLDKDYDDRTRRVFRGPVYVPMWWGRYDPAYRPASSGGQAAPVSMPSSSGKQGLPGADFAASMVTGVQTFSQKVIGNINTFTGKVTGATNPPPKPSSSGRRGGGGGGRSCACACACAGCACACAGGGR
ncbi:MAG: hypothetical protein PHQ36_01090 [Anaerolineales bacterium]|nr:hypothetical protein [Anaerolineales bacterium]